MKHRVEFTQRALKDLKRLDRYTSALIFEWIWKMSTLRSFA